MGFIKGLVTAALYVAAFAAVVGGFLHLFFVDVYTVPHNGMAPTIVYDDQVLVWRHAGVDMGNVMLCEHPAVPGQLVLGRAIAFAGHTVSTDGRGNLFVDSNRATNEQLGTQRFYDVTLNKLFIMTLTSIEFAGLHTHSTYTEEGSTFALNQYEVNQGVYLLGDNRSDPIDDSREFGEIDPVACKGQVFMRWRPAPRQDDDIDHFYLDIIK
jgi:signal peptidase I